MENEANLDGVDAAATGTLIDEINELLDSPVGGVDEPPTSDEPLVEAPLGDGVVEGTDEVEVKKDEGIVEDLTPLAQSPSEIDDL